MVAAANPHAAQAGLRVLEQGGTAADALVATQLVLNLVEPQSSGIGGGAFLLYWDADTKSLTTYDARETAPKAADDGYFLKGDGSKKGFWEAMVGGSSVGVPGTAKLLEMVHAEHGELDWDDLFRPAIKLAEDGFAVSPRLASSIRAHATEQRQLGKFDDAREYFFDDGEPLAAGSVLTNEDFANTLRDMASKGSQVIYSGDIPEEIIKKTSSDTDNPGRLTLGDFAAYEVIKRPPVCVAYRQYEVCGMGPPSSGGLAVGQILGILEHFDMAAAGPTAKGAHLIAEASRLAFADRNHYVGDSDFVDVPVEGMLDPNYLRQRAALVDPDQATPGAQPGEVPGAVALGDRAAGWSLDRPGTSHFVIVDEEGNMASMTTTIESGFGSRLMVGGFLLNNELTDFSFAAEQDGKPVANRIEGGKRPRSSMAPTIILQDGEPVILVGSPGGSRIIGYVAQAIVAMVDWGMGSQDAVSMGHVVNRNGATDLEAGTIAESWKDELEGMGHEVNVRALTSGLHAIAVMDDGSLVGGADPRREGVVAASLD